MSQPPSSSGAAALTLRSSSASASAAAAPGPAPAPASPASAPGSPAEPAGPPLPLVELRYAGLRYSVKLQAQQQARNELPSVFRTIANVALALPRRLLALGAPRAPPARDFVILDDVSGVIRPGTLTLVLAPPGHGKSAFLKALTQALPKGEVKGEITYSGVTAAEAPARGVYLGALCQYVNQVDEHLPQLTVRETFEFIRSNAAVDPSEHGFPHLAGAHAEAVEDILQLLSLKNCEKARPPARSIPVCACGRAPRTRPRPPRSPSPTALPPYPTPPPPLPPCPRADHNRQRPRARRVGRREEARHGRRGPADQRARAGAG